MNVGLAFADVLHLQTKPGKKGLVKNTIVAKKEAQVFLENTEVMQ